MRRIRITPTIEYIEPEGKRKFYACSGLAVTGRVKIAIDANPGRSDTKDFLTQFKPDIAIVSHYHPDHSSWCSQVLEHSTAELLIPHDEEPYFRSVDYLVTHAAGNPSVQNLMRDFASKLLSYREIETFVTYDSPCSFILGDISLDCIRSAGHSPGHTSFYFPGQKVLFASDMGIDRLGPWYGWNDCSIEAMIESIFALRSLDVKLLVTSHGGIFIREIRQCWDRALIQILDREQKILDALEKGKTREEIIDEGVCYPKKEKVREPIKSFFIMWDSVMFDLHAKILSTTCIKNLYPKLRSIVSEYEKP